MDAKDIHEVVGILKEEAANWQTPVVSRYVQSPFRVLISCILSLRTQDKTTYAASERLFQITDEPQNMVDLSLATIEKAIYPVGFYRIKAINIKEICQILITRYGGQVPDELEELLKLPGVGRKTANLVITMGYGKLGICVDTHVHRITNRWGYIKTKHPEETEMALRRILPQHYWIIINDLLVAYGQNICKPLSPICSQCRLQPYCDQVGVKKSR
jgi:endonuclease-3